jgi:Zinc knuckle
MLYESQSDCDTALTFLRKAQPSTSDAEYTGSAVNNITPAYSSEPSSNIAHSMATRLKADQKFTGKLGEDLTEFISTYMDAANDYYLFSKQKLDHMHHLLDGEAKRFYREKMLSSCATFAEATSMMQEEFNSLTRQNRVRKHLQKLRLSTTVGNRRYTVTEALEELREIIDKLTPQGPMTHRSKEDKAEYLYKAVVGATWANSALSSSQSSSPPWNFQTLYAAFDAAWLQEQEEVEARQFDGKVHGRFETTVERQIPGLRPQGQEMYGRPKAPGYRWSAPSRSSIGNTSNNAPGKNGIDWFEKPQLCKNCQSPDHFIRDCDKPRNILRNVAQQIKNNPEQIRQILFKTCVCKLNMPASRTKTKNSSHSLPKLRTAKN